MSDASELDPDLICRDEDCEIDEIHKKHFVQHHRRSEPHHRPKPGKPPWERDDRKGLRMSIEKAATSGLPMNPASIVRDVRDDYGRVHERTVYRHLSNIVKLGHVLKLDLRLSFSVYLAPNSPLLRDLESIREYMIGCVDQAPVTKGRRRRLAEGV